MEKKRISLNGLKKVLSPKEMKNVLGGSGNCMTIDEGGCKYYCCRDGGGNWMCENLGCIG